MFGKMSRLVVARVRHSHGVRQNHKTAFQYWKRFFLLNKFFLELYRWVTLVNPVVSVSPGQGLIDKRM